MEVSAKKSSTIKKLLDNIIQDIIKRDESSSSSDSNGKVNNNILSNVTTLRTNNSLKNGNGLSNDSESFFNYETSSYFLKAKNTINENNDYIKNLNNLQDIRNREIMRKSIYYKSPKKCFIF